MPTEISTLKSAAPAPERANRVLDLDHNREHSVIVGGREFVVRPQRCAVIQRIALAVGRAEDRSREIMRQAEGAADPEEVIALLEQALEGTDPVPRAKVEAALQLLLHGKENDFDNVKYTEAVFANFEAQRPLFADIFGFDEGHPERPAVLEHLEEHLLPPDAQAIFALWWEVNRVRDFLLYGGNVLIPRLTSSNGAPPASETASSETPTSS